MTVPVARVAATHWVRVTPVPTASTATATPAPSCAAVGGGAGLRDHVNRPRIQHDAAQFTAHGQARRIEIGDEDAGCAA